MKVSNLNNRKILSSGIILIIFISIVLGYIILNNKNVKNSLIKVGIVDSGCAENQKNVKEYKNFALIQYGYPSNDQSPYDTLNHGSTVCSLINQNSNNIEIYSAKIAHSNGILTYQGLYAAINWLVSVKKVNIINLSLGASPLISDEIENFSLKLEQYSKSVVFVAAAGNTGSESYNSNGLGEWPAILPWVIGVGAFNQSNFGEQASYSATGLSFTSTFVTEYSAYYNNRLGTSFTTPLITAKIIKILQFFNQNNINYSLNLLRVYLDYYSHSTFGGFNENVGWGFPIFDNVYKLSSNLVYFEFPNNFNDKLRLINETWKVIIPLNYNIDSLNLDNSISFSGNASSILSNYVYNFKNWGGTLVLNFNASNGFIESNYSLKILSKYGNEIHYQFNLKQSKGKILLDLRTSVNGYGHPYGEFTNLEDLFRNSGYIFNYRLNSLISNGSEVYNNDLSNYNLVITPNLFQNIFDGEIYVNRTKYDNIATEYEDYIKNGGFLLGFTDFNLGTRVQKLNDFFDKIGAHQTYNEIQLADKPVTVYNFTNSPYMSGVLNFNFQGEEIIPTNSNVTSLGWYTNQIIGPVSTIYLYYSIGVSGTYGQGKFILFGDSSLINNVNFKVTGIHFDRVIDNILP